MKWPVVSAALLVFMLGLFGSTASAYVLAVDSSGNILKWPTPAKPTFYANWNNADLLKYNQIFNSFTHSLQRWRYTGSSAADFDYIQSGSSVVRTAYDAQNAIFFSSQSTQKLGSGTIGVTYVYSSGGNILETDVEFNDDNFIFTTNPTDSTMFGDGIHVFLENVATHEFGHAFGLSHSATLQSSMVYLESRGQAKPACDDIAGLAALYPLASFTSGRGSLSGTIVDAGVTNIFGAHVLAISKTRGTVVSSAITQANGTFLIPNLEPGDYYVLVEPFAKTAPVSSLCGGSAAGCFYGTVNSADVCGAGVPFKRAFVETMVGTPTKFSVTSGMITPVPMFTVGCADMGDPAFPTTTAALAAVSSANVPSSYAARGIFGAVGTSQYFLLQNASGNIAVKALAYGLYSPVDVKVSILNAGGVNVATGAVSTDNVFFNANNFINYDASASLASAPAADYIVKVTYNGSLSALSSLYPSGIVQAPSGTFATQIDTVKYYLLIVTIGDTTTLLPSTASPTMTNNARCEATDTFAAFPDKGTGPPTSTSSTSGASSGGGSGSKGGGCGTIRNHDDNGDGIGPDASALTSAWGVMLILLMMRSLQRLATRRNAR